MPKRGSSVVGTFGILAVFVLVAAGVLGWGVWSEMRGQATRIPLKTPAEYRDAEIRVLQKLEAESIEDARAQGKGEAEVERIKARFKDEIDKLRAVDVGMGP